MGALLDLHIGFGYVLSHDTQAEKLQAADEDDDTDGGSPAWDRIIEDQLSDDDGYQDQKGKTGHGRSEPGGDGQRYLRKIDDAADGVFKQLPEVPFGLTGYAFDIFVGEPAGAETDPAEDSLGEACDAFEEDKYIQEVLGEHISKKYLEAKRKEWHEYCRQVSDWETEAYLYKY